jgi:hypothetical protein
VEVLLPASEEGPRVRGQVLDRSQGGLRILIDEAVDEGTELKVRATTAPATSPWIDITVPTCRRDGVQYEIGCQFRQTPPWNVLLHFG